MLGGQTLDAFESKTITNATATTEISRDIQWKIYIDISCTITSQSWSQKHKHNHPRKPIRPWVHDRHDAYRLLKKYSETKPSAWPKAQQPDRTHNLHQETPSLLAMLRKTAPVQRPNTTRAYCDSQELGTSWWIQKREPGPAQSNHWSSMFQVNTSQHKSTQRAQVLPLLCETQMECGRGPQSFPSPGFWTWHSHDFGGVTNDLLPAIDLGWKAKIWIAV